MALTPEQLAALRSMSPSTAANRVRLARNLCDLKQNDLAAATGFTSPQLSDIERGEYKDIPLENARRLSAFFGCRIEDLFPSRDVEAPAEITDGDRRAGERRDGERRQADRRGVEA